MPVTALKYPQNSGQGPSPFYKWENWGTDFSVCLKHTAKWNIVMKIQEDNENILLCQVSYPPLMGHRNRIWLAKWKRWKMCNPQNKALFLPDITFILRLGIIFPFISEGFVHIYPLLVIRFRVCLVFNNQIYVFSIVYKYCSIHHREDINESFI